MTVDIHKFKKDGISFIQSITNIEEFIDELKRDKFEVILEFDDSSGIFIGQDHGEEIVYIKGAIEKFIDWSEFVIASLFIGYGIDNSADAFNMLEECNFKKITIKYLWEEINKHIALLDINLIRYADDKVIEAYLVSDLCDHFFVVWKTDQFLHSFAYRYFN